MTSSAREGSPAVASSATRGRKIVIVIGSLELGGAERQLTRLAAELQSLGHAAHVVTLCSLGPLSDFLARHAIPATCLGFRASALRPGSGASWARRGRELLKLARLPLVLRRLRPDVCYSALDLANLFAMPAAWLAGVPCRVSGWRGLSDSSRRPRGFLLALRSAQRFADASIANCQAVADEVVRTGLGTWRRMQVVYNGVDAHPPGDVDVARQPATGVAVGNLIPYKGHLDLVKALAMLHQAPRMELVGQGIAQPEIEKAIAEHGLGDVCRLLGSRVDTAAVRERAQFAVMPSHTEGFPNALLEAMSVGLPTIATRVGGIPELVRDGVEGLLVPARDPEALAQAIEKLASDADLRSRLGRAGRQRSARFTWQACRDAHLQVFEEVLARKRVRRARPEAGWVREARAAAGYDQPTPSSLPCPSREVVRNVRHRRLP